MAPGATETKRLLPLNWGEGHVGSSGGPVSREAGKFWRRHLSPYRDLPDQRGDALAAHNGFSRTLNAVKVGLRY